MKICVAVGMEIHLILFGHLVIVMIPGVRRRIYFAHYRRTSWSVFHKPRFEFWLRIG